MVILESSHRSGILSISRSSFYGSKGLNEPLEGIGVDQIVDEFPFPTWTSECRVVEASGLFLRGYLATENNFLEGPWVAMLPTSISRSI